MLEIKDYTPVKDQGSYVKAYVSFFIPEWGLHLNNCKYIRKRNGGFFVAYPSKTVEKEGEDTKYYPYYTFSMDRNDKFQSAAQRAIQDWLTKNEEGYMDDLF